MEEFEEFEEFEKFEKFKAQSSKFKGYMKKGVKISLWMGGVLVVLAAAVMGILLMIHLYIGHYICEIVNEKYAHNDTVMVHIDEVKVGHFDYLALLVDKRLEVKELTIVHPTIVSTIPAKPEPKDLAEAEQQRLQDQQRQEADIKQMLSHIGKYLNGFQIDALHVENAEVEIKTKKNKLHETTDSIYIDAYALSYSVLDTAIRLEDFGYDSLHYSLRVGKMHLISPDGLTEITSEGIHTEDAGPLWIGKTRIKNTVGMWEMGKYHEPGPQSWVDMTIKEAHTSPIHLHTMIGNDAFELDSIYATVERLHAARDLRQKALKPIPMPQAGLLDLKFPFYIKAIKADIQTLRIDIAITNENRGTIDLSGMHALVNNITAQRMATIYAAVRGRLGKGTINAKAAFTVNRQCSWKLDIEAKDAEMSSLNKFMLPVMAMNLGGHITSLKTEYSGNDQTAKGTFCMQYEDLSARVEKTPKPAFEIVHNLRGIINSFVETCVPHSNPRTAGKAPNAFEVEWKHDEMMPAELFLVGPLINGCVKTMLPGLYLRSRLQGDTGKTKSELRAEKRAAKKAEREALKEQRRAEKAAKKRIKEAEREEKLAAKKAAKAEKNGK